MRTSGRRGKKHRQNAAFNTVHGTSAETATETVTQALDCSGAVTQQQTNPWCVGALSQKEANNMAFTMNRDSQRDLYMGPSTGPLKMEFCDLFRLLFLFCMYAMELTLL